MAREDLAQISEYLLAKGKPFLDELEKREMADLAAPILESLQLISEDPQTACWNLYLLLQSEAFNDIQDENKEPGRALMFLYSLMSAVLSQALSMELIRDIEKS